MDKSAVFSASFVDAPKSNMYATFVESTRILQDPATKSTMGVTKLEDLKNVPPEYLSGDEKRPLLFWDRLGNKYTYALKPMMFSVVFILCMEALERMAYYGVSYTLTSYLTGNYGTWSPQLGAVQAASWVQVGTAITYVIPFFGAIIADGLIGNYWTIILFSSLIYLPGLLLIALSALPELFPGGFPTSMLAASVLGLYPIGAGGIKAGVSVMGAQQFHPILHASQITKYYVRFYMFINIGALVGGISLPIIIQHSVFAAYIIPTITFFIALTCFVSATPRYVRMKPLGSDILTSVVAAGSSLKTCPPSMEKVKKSNGGKYDDNFIEKVKVIGGLIPIMLLIVPFNIAYSQMSNVFIIQGQVMEPLGFINAAWIQNFDAFSVLIFGFLVSTFLYPYLDKHNIKIKMVHKFGVGTIIAVLALACAIIIDYQIHAVYDDRQEAISIMWQVFPFMLIGMGEIFAISSAYDAAFTLSPPGLKTFGSAINLFMVGCVPNLLSSAILNASRSMAFTDDSGSDDLTTLSQYAQAHVYKYLWILFGIGILGVIICFLPPVHRFYEKIQTKSMDITESESNQCEGGSIYESFLGGSNARSIFEIDEEANDGDDDEKEEIDEKADGEEGNTGSDVPQSSSN